MFWKKKESGDGVIEKGPQNVPGIVQQYLIKEKKVEPDFAPLFKAVTRSNGNGAISIRIYDESDAAARKLIVKNYSELNNHPDLVLFEGSFDEKAKTVALEEKNQFNWNTPIYTEDQLRQKIEGLTQPGSMAFFYQTRGANNGGPLGKGASVIELNPQYPGKGQKKYNVYCVDVVGLQPAEKGAKLWAADKPKEIAQWVKQGHEKRLYS
jgi:hypothetical protein